MLTALVLATLGAEPLNLFVETVKTSPQHEAEAHVWTQALAAELRRWGFRVTTQDELAQVISGEKQKQQLGCEDKDCGLDRNILDIADARLQTSAVGEDGYMVSMSVYFMKGRQRAPPWSQVISTDSYSEALDGIREVLPRVIDGMRAEAKPGQIPEKPASNAAEPKPVSSKRCSAGGAAPFGLAAALALRPWRRRSWKWRARAG